MCSGEASAQNGRTHPAELASRVPPNGEVHLADTGDDETQTQELIEVMHRDPHRHSTYGHALSRSGT